MTPRTAFLVANLLLLGILGSWVFVVLIIATGGCVALLGWALRAEGDGSS